MKSAPTTLPIGPPVDAHPAKRPERVTFEGRWITLVPLAPQAHAKALYDGSNGDAARESVWAYLFDGPYANFDEFRTNLEAKARSTDPLFFTVIDKASGDAVGYQTFLRIDPPNRVIEVGNILYTPVMQRTAGATEAQYLFARYVFEDTRQSPLRVEVQRAQRAVAARGGAVRLHIRGHFPPAHDRQGPQPRHRLVRNAGQRVADA